MIKRMDMRWAEVNKMDTYPSFPKILQKFLHFDWTKALFLKVSLSSIIPFLWRQRQTLWVEEVASI